MRFCSSLYPTNEADQHAKGVPLSDLTPASQLEPANGESQARVIREPRLTGADIRPASAPSSITFVRHRMLYARSSLTLKGEPRYGLRHIRSYNAATLCRSD